MRALPLAALLLVTSLGLAAADEAPLPTHKQAEAAMALLLKVNQGTLEVGTLKVGVSFVPDYAEYRVLRDYLDIDLAALDPAKVRNQVLASAKAQKKRRGKLAVILHLTQAGHARTGDADFYTSERPLLKKLVLSGKGVKSIKLSPVWKKGLLERVVFKLFTPTKSLKNPGSRTKKALYVYPADYRLDLVVKGKLSPKLNAVYLSMGRFVRFSGPGITKDQVDLSGGSKRTAIRAARVYGGLPAGPPLSFVLPTLAKLAFPKKS